MLLHGHGHGLLGIVAIILILILITADVHNLHQETVPLDPESSTVGVVGHQLEHSY